MSRTYRKQPVFHHEWHHIPPYEVVVRDGYRDMGVELARDDRVTGLRTIDHRRDRRKARRNLDAGEDVVRSGKCRRYTDKRGMYDW